MNETLPRKTIASNRRVRSAFTPEQTQVLEQFFAHTPYPDVTTRESLSQRLDIDENRLQIWFSNRRARTRKSTMKSSNRLHSSPVSTMKSDIVFPSFSASPVIEASHFKTPNIQYEMEMTSGSPSRKH